MSVLMEQHLAHQAARARLWGRKLPRPPAPAAARDVLAEAAKREADIAAAAELAARLERAKLAKENSGPHWYRIVAEVAKKHDLHPRDLTSSSRSKPIVIARYEAFYRMRTEILVGGLPMSFPAIGRRFGGMDHTSVMHGFRKHEANLNAGIYQNPVERASLVDERTPTHSIEDHLSNGRVV